MKNILFYGDYDCTTGFSMVAKELINEWKDHPEIFITVFATNNHAKEPYSKGNIYVIPALATRNEDDKDMYARLSLLKLLYNGSYDLLFCLNDIEVINALAPHLKEVKTARKKENKKSFKSIIYFPIDSEVRKQDLDVLEQFDEVVTYTQYAKDEITRHLGVKKTNKIKIIPHAVSDSFYYKPQTPLSISSDAFRFGTVNRNSVRKDMGTLLLAFAELKKKNTTGQKLELYMHCNPTDPFGINLYRLCQRLNLEIDKDVIFSEGFNENKGFSEEELNDIYNSFDCFITTTTAEGYGLTVAEAMKTKTLVIAPLHTSLNEVTDFGSVIIPIRDLTTCVFKDDFEKIRYQCDTKAVLSAMGYALNITPQRQFNKIENAYKHITKWTWKKVAYSFLLLIKKELQLNSKIVSAKN